VKDACGKPWRSSAPRREGRPRADAWRERAGPWRGIASRRKERYSAGACGERECRAVTGKRTHARNASARAGMWRKSAHCRVENECVENERAPTREGRARTQRLCSPGAVLLASVEQRSITASVQTHGCNDRARARPRRASAGLGAGAGSAHARLGRGRPLRRAGAAAFARRRRHTCSGESAAGEPLRVRGSRAGVRGHVRGKLGGRCGAYTRARTRRVRAGVDTSSARECEREREGKEQAHPRGASAIVVAGRRQGVEKAACVWTWLACAGRCRECATAQTCRVREDADM
jgi:hypothetical protein